MQVIQNIVSAVPYGESTLHKAEQVIEYSKDKTLNVYNTTRTKITETHKGYVQFRKSVNLMIANITQEAVNEVLSKVENFVGIKSNKRKPETVQQLRERLQAIFQVIFRQYVLKNRIIVSKRVQALIQAGRNINIEYLVPLYINLKATLIVTKEMFIEFLQSKLNDFKLNYESSKDNVIMFVHGNFREEALKEKVFEGIDSFKKFTVRVVNRGLEIRVDRQSLMQNYDKFAINLLEVVKQLREKGEDNITEIKKKSRDLYRQVVSRIRAKELQIRTDLKSVENKSIFK